MNQIIMILLISLLVLVHEAGHFIAARMCGIRVTRFGIGMPIGPSLKIFKWGHTDFYLHAFLFGGYVSFPEDTQKEDEKNGEEVLPSDSSELYENKTIAQKLFVVSAGVLMNIVFAIFLVIFCASVFHKLPTSNQNLYVDNFSSNKTSNIQEVGLIKGDKILKVNDIKIDSMYQLTLFAKNSKLFDDYAQKDLIEKNLAELKKINPQIKNEISNGQKIKLPKANVENSLELNKNILIGLERYKKDGVELSQNQIELRNKIYSKKSFLADKNYTLNDFAIALSDTYKPIKITVLRNNKEFSFENIKVEKEGIFGMMLKIEEIFIPTNTFKEIIIKSFDYLYTTTSTMLKSLWQLITGKVSVSDMHGVIAVVKIGGDIIASKGLLNGLLLTAMISINLAIMNFLPIPALDGGHVMFLLIEKITGKKPSKELGEKITNFFFILLIILMIAICYNDIFALVTKKF
ncbi:MAG: RIP metalloprotease RseP [Candidatus Gastranaerophilales bacterium]|nr:RIP metalloprotease RseP [Candidatus Gastranaerophilales bacterium]